MTAPGGTKTNKGWRMNSKDVKNRYSVLHGGNRSDGGSKGCKSKGSGKDNASDDTKKTGGSSKVNTIQGEEERIRGPQYGEHHREKSGKRSIEVTGTGRTKTAVCAPGGAAR